MPRSIAGLPSSRHRRRQSLTAKIPMGSLRRRARADAEAQIRSKTGRTNRRTARRILVPPAAARTPMAINKTTETARGLVVVEWVVAGGRDKRPKEPAETRPRIASTRRLSTFARLSRAGVFPKNCPPSHLFRARTGNRCFPASQHSMIQ